MHRLSTRLVSFILFLVLAQTLRAQNNPVLTYRDIVLCPGESIELFGLTYNSADTFTVTLIGEPPAPDTIALYRIHVAQNVADPEACNCHPASFLKKFGLPAQNESGIALARSSDGNVYQAGRRQGQTYIQKMNTSGEVIWTRGFSLGFFDPVTPVQIFEDSDGMLVGCGTQGDVPGFRKGFAFRYDPETNAFLWTKTISGNSPEARGILEKGPGGHYVYYQSPANTGNNIDAEILELERLTGNINTVFSKRLEYKSSDVLNKLVYWNGSLYGTGWVDGITGIQNGARRQLLARFDAASGAPEWAQLGHLDTSAVANLFGRDLLVEDSSIIAAYDGNDESQFSAISNRLYVQKTQLDGTVLWVNQYNISGYVAQILSTPDGYVLYGPYYDNKYFILKINKNGALLWSRVLEYGPVPGTPLSTGGGNGLVLDDGSLLFNGTIDADAFLLRLDANGMLQDSCSAVRIATPSYGELTTTTTPFQCTQIFGSPQQQTNSLPVQADELFETFLCPDCVPADPCPEANDFVISLNQTGCQNGRVNLSISICDLDGGALPDAINVTFYNDNPTLGAAAELGIFQFQTTLGADSCQTFFINDIGQEFGAAAAQEGFTLFAVVNFDGSLNTPFALDQLPSGNIDECRYDNNLDSFKVQLPTAPTLDLGPDRSLCVGQNALLNAGTAFYRYRWSNGADDDKITVTQSGLYAITATDACGREQYDSIQVVFNALPTLSVSDSLCPGSTLTLYGREFTQGGTFLDTIPATAGIGCDTVVTFFIKQRPYNTQSFVIQFCPGDTLYFGGIPYFESGLARDTVAGSFGCDTIISYILDQLPKPFRNDQYAICPGDTLFLYGETFTQAGNYTRTVVSTNGGCDTLVNFFLNFLPLPSRTETVLFCQGESVSINGQVYDQPGQVIDTLTAGNGACDTVVTYILQYLDPPPSNLSLQCPDDVFVATTPGSGPVLVNYDAPEWQTDCSCPGTTLSLGAGLPSGSAFPVGNTNVCYLASDACGATSSCCFLVQVREEMACDIKTTACLKYEILEIYRDAGQQMVYRIRVTNQCANPMNYVAFSIPNSITAVNPVNNSTFTTVQARNYTVRNPNYSPFYSIRFKSTTDSIAGGQSDIFEYTLPEQTPQSYIHVTARLEPQLFYEAYLNTFNCPVGNGPANKAADRHAASVVAAPVRIYPNPTDGRFHADFSAWGAQNLRLKFINTLGKTAWEAQAQAGPEAVSFALPATVENGIYFLQITGSDGQMTTLRLVVERP